MTRQIARAETYETVHQAFSQINFNAFDYNTIKKSLVDYMKIYFPEDFNDFIESSELIAIIETFSYVAELISYRLDMNAQENFLSTAQRKESILRLAKLISYKPSRNIPHRGLVKLTSIKTTETIRDVDGLNLANVDINWNDNNNAKWKDQFILIMNQVMEQNFGSVGADSRAQVDNVLFELYTMKNNARNNNNNNSVFPFNVTVSDTSFDMELVPVILTEDGPEEKRPEVRAPFSVMYASDGLGDASDTTGFVMMVKQGTLQKREAFFDGITPNQTFDVPVTNINHTDVFINNVNSDDRKLLINDPFENIFRNDGNSLYGEWFEVGTNSFENVVFNTNANRRKFDVETLDDDQIRIIFGDGEFSDIPNGAFDIWFRTSANESITVPKSSISNEEASFVYLDENGITQTFTFNFSLVNALQNSSKTESLEHIRRVAPSVYYTQDRMVNARDYNTYMLQDPRIVKLKAINRTFAGDSKYIAWHDPKEYYENTKIFGNDLALFRKKENPTNGFTLSINTAVTSLQLIENHIEPLLSSLDFFLMVVSKLELLGETDLNYRTVFSESDLDPLNPTVPIIPEKTAIATALDDAANSTNSSGTIGNVVSLYYSVENDRWYVNTFDPSYLLVFQIAPVFINGNTIDGWTINQATDSLIAYSNTTRFWNENGPDAQLNLSSLLSETDTLTVLAANVKVDNSGVLDSDIQFNVVKQESLNDDFDTINSLAIMPIDVNSDEIPDNLNQPELFGGFGLYSGPDLPLPAVPSTNPKLETTLGIPNTLELDTPYLQGFEDEDVEIYVKRAGSSVFERMFYGTDWFTPPLGTPSNADPSTIIRTWIQLSASEVMDGDEYRIRSKRYVYLCRDSINDPWAVKDDSESIKLLYFQEATSSEAQRRYTRYEGRYPMNFSWFHTTPRLHLVDPAPSNIIDIFVITDGYYRDFNAYLNGTISFVPEKPSSYQLTRTFTELLRSKMISDTVVMHSGSLRPLFGAKAAANDRAKIKIILSSQNTLSENDIKNQVIGVVTSFFDSSNWNFGETFYFSELSAAIHANLNASIKSVVLVPDNNNLQFGDLYQIKAREDEIFIPTITSGEIEIIQSLDAENLKQ